jgi:DNA-binding NarL/FixJ family response regulator
VGAVSIRLVIADDHAIWRSGLRADLGEAFAVVGEAADGAEAIEVIGREKPDLALVDLHMEGGGGMAVVTACAAQCPIVILTVSEAERDLLDAVAAGAVGYLTKSTRPDDLRAAIRRAAAGEPVFSPQLAALVIGRVPSPVQHGWRCHPGAVAARTGGGRVGGSGSHLQGGGRGPVHLAQDGREPRAQHHGQAPPVTPS